MSGPWDDFATAEAPAEAGPWADFKPAAKAPAAAPRTGAAAVPTEAEAKGQPYVPPPAQAPAEPPTVTQKITGAVEAGLNLVSQLAGGLVGGITGTARTVQQSGAAVSGAVQRKLQGLPPEEMAPRPSLLQNQSEDSAAVAAALKRTVSGPMNLQEAQTPDTELGQQYTEALQPAAETVMGAAPLHGTMGPAGGVKAAAKGATELGPRSIVRNVAADVTPLVRDSAQVAAEQGKATKIAAPENQGIVDAIQNGYKVTPKAGGGSKVSRSAQTAAGSARLEQSLSAHNAENTARLARQDIGVPEDAALTPELTKQVRAEAGQDYAAVQDVGQIALDGQLQADLGRISSDFKEGGKDFTLLGKNPIIGVIDTLQSDTGKPVNTGSIISQVRDLRAKADTAYGNSEAQLGNAYRAAGQALDNAMERSLTKQAEVSGDAGLADAVSKYQAARVRIAKTYMLDDAMRGATKPGEVNATAYRQALDKGTRLDGPGLAIAKFAKQFGGEGLAKSKSKSGAEGPTWHDIVLGALHPGAALAKVGAVMARPAVRSLLGSDLMQQRLLKGAQERLPAEEPAAPAAAPVEPTTSPGAAPEGAGGGGGAAPGPLGDLTPEWQTTPGAGGGPTAPAIEPTGLVPAVGEKPITRFVPDQRAETPTKRAGNEIPAVSGRPDVPDTMLTGHPSESAATERSNAAMLEPGAQEAMRRQELARQEAARAEIPVGEAREVPAGEGVGAPKTPKQGSIPVGKTAEGQPEIKGAQAPKKIPAGEATELTPEVIELGRKWQREYKLGDDDVQRAHAVARAFDHDPEAVAAAAEKFDNNPTAFDREIERVNVERTARENEVNSAARRGASDAGSTPTGTGATAAPVSGEAAGTGGVREAKPTGESDAAVRANGDQNGANGTAKTGALVIREVPGGFEAYRDGKKVGYLKDNLERGQAEQIGENANVEMVKVDKEVQGTGVGRALYEAFNDKHGGRILPSGKTEPSAWKLWKRNYPEKVDAFVQSEAARIKDGADPKLVVGNITDPEVAQRVQEAANGTAKQQREQVRPNDLQQETGAQGIPEGTAQEKGPAPEEVAGWRLVGDVPTKRVRTGDGVHTVVKLPDGGVRRIQRLDSTSSMGVPGWHDMDSSQHSYLADTEADAIKVLMARSKKT